MGAKELIASFFGGLGATIGIASGISVVVSKAKADEIKESPWRCAYDGLRFPDENSLIRHILTTYRPDEPSNPRKNPPPAPVVFLAPLPNPRYSGVEDAYGLWRITIYKIRENGVPIFQLKQLKWTLTAQATWKLGWVIGFCGPRALMELKTVNWVKRLVQCEPMGDRPVGGFAGYIEDTYLRIPKYGIEPILIWKEKK